MPQDTNLGSFTSPSATMKASNFHVVNDKAVIDVLKQTIDMGCHFITVMGGIILIAGVAIASFNLVKSVVNDIFGTEYPMMISSFRRKQLPATFSRVRMQLGEITAFGLEVLVVSDILETLVKGVDGYSYETLGKIAAVAIFRTALAYFLAKDYRTKYTDELDEKKI